jgi:hypothetical protein
VVVAVLEDLGEDRGRDIWQRDHGVLSGKICVATSVFSSPTDSIICHRGAASNPSFSLH